MAHIVFGKMGKSVLFDPDSWGPIGGDNEAALLLYALSRYCQHDTIWLVSKSDYEKVGLKLPNVRYVFAKEYWEEGVNPNQYFKDNNQTLYYTYVDRLFTRLGIEPDFGIFLYGMFFSCSMAGSIPKQDGSGKCGALEAAQKYGSFINYLLNKRKFPWVSVVTDPRQYECQPRDLVHYPFVNLSQINTTLQFKGGKIETPVWDFPGIKQTVRNQHVQHHAFVELMHLLSKTPNASNFELNKDRKGLNIVLNQGFPAAKAGEMPARYHVLHQYILAAKELECSIYGKWDEEVYKRDERFKGPVPLAQLGDVIQNTKYTFCIPIAPGWMTAKFTEMAHYGIIPFVHESYASKATNYIDPWFIIRSPQDLVDKILQCENDQAFYAEKLQWLKDLLLPGGKLSMYNGQHLLRMMFHTIRKYGSDIGKTVANMIEGGPDTSKDIYRGMHIGPLGSEYLGIVEQAKASKPAKPEKKKIDKQPEPVVQSSTLEEFF